MRMKRKNPYFGGFLGLILAFFSTIYFGFRAFILSFVAVLAATIVMFIFKLYDPSRIFGYIIPIVFAIHNFSLTRKYNILVNELNEYTNVIGIVEYEEYEKEIKTAFDISYATKILFRLITTALVISSISDIITAFKSGHIWAGVLLLILTPFFVGVVLLVTDLIKNLLFSLYVVGEYAVSKVSKSSTI